VATDNDNPEIIPAESVDEVIEPTVQKNVEKIKN
jgi:hypothetical protein